ncbi:MAG TPA: hypothetical protein VGU46_05100 [Acidobacteriaceae bacterium]|nr:hypothetical protein [Acidobacteriaceae bacterium]
MMLTIVGCHYDPTVWKESIHSPDGAWIAEARTDQWGGFGSAYVATTVSLTRVDRTYNKGKAFDILIYPGGGQIPKTYVLSDDNADQDLNLNWLSPTHLEITHASPMEAPNLEVIRFGNVDVSYKLGQPPTQP